MDTNHDTGIGSATTGARNLNLGVIPWALDVKGYMICLGPDGQVYRSSVAVSEASNTTPLRFLPIGNLPPNVIGRQGSTLADTGQFADREVAGVSSR